KPWRRLVVLFAGPLMNLATAVILFSMIIGQMGGIPVLSDTNEDMQNVIITEVVPNSPADQAGVQVGDILTGVAGQTLESQDAFNTIIIENVDQPVILNFERNGTDIDLSVVPRMNEDAGRPMIGIGYRSAGSFMPITSLSENLKYSVLVTGQQIGALVTLPVRLIQGTIPAEQGRLVGLKGIFDIMGQSVSSDVEAARTNTASPSASSNPFNQPVETLFILASLSISLGIFNLFPFPALDGGRIVFVLPELIFRRRVPHQFENLVHGIGMMLLLAVMIYVNIKDFIDPITNSFP
ncbi:MAG TPA: M50 family metallopeptidase, partial [Anaerolineales bacterium]|nr:M50 family metallopeptidase [Anaerolineales bacterium]